MSSDKALYNSTGNWSGLWFGLSWYLIGFGVVLGSQFVAAVIVAVFRSDGLVLNRTLIGGLLGDGDVLSLTFFIALPVFVVLLYPWILYLHRQSPGSYLAINAVSLRNLVAWSVAMAAVLAIYLLSATMLNRPQVPDWMLDTWRTVDNMAAFIVAVSILGPIFEEVLCRGYMLKAFADSKMGPLWGSIIVSGLWAVTHFQYDAFDIGWIFLLGLLLCAARLMTGSLVTPIVLHGLWNFISMVAVYRYLN